MQEAIPDVKGSKLGMNFSMYNKFPFRIWVGSDANLEVALVLPAAAAAAQLKPTETTSLGIIVVKDTWLPLQGDNQGCGFHEDDPFLWLCAVDAPGTVINCMIALNDNDEDGGRLTIASHSHLLNFLDCRDAIKCKKCWLVESDGANHE
eukprot:gb/GEZJ01001433.1/.p2 GENE.gb/GEZJ01001433.1/~~gb/GEZJ01001433.1/.p2  ORF type:complete len:149 (+),score=15.51 gb/GEZJ01001433.1/:758-1204(+)